MSTATSSKNYEHRGRPNPVRNPGPPNRKIAAKLERRMRDYAIMVNQQGWKAPEGAFHRPGSMQK